MGRPHKLAGSRLSARTDLPPARIRELCAESAAVATGNRWDGRSTVHLVGSTGTTDQYELRSGLRGTFKQLDFRVSLTQAGERTDVTTMIGWYRTSQTVIAGFIPFGPKTMLGHHVYLQFVQDLAQRLAAADPSASVSLYKGEQPMPVAAAGSPAVGAAPAPPADAVTRTCAACGTTTVYDDAYCGGCGTALDASGAAPAPAPAWGARPPSTDWDDPAAGSEPAGSGEATTGTVR